MSELLALNPIQAAVDAAVEELNDTYFVVRLNGRTVIGSIIHDDALDRDVLVLSTPQDLRLLFGNRKVKVGSNKHGKDVERNIASIWLEHAKRRTYRSMQLYPGGNCPPDVFNLWRGWGVAPAAGDWPTIEDHLRTVICAGNDGHYAWLIGWLAHIVQNPAQPAEVAVVLRGKKGIGKGLFGQMLMKIFCHHAIHLFNAKHLVGHFNAHLADALFVYVDEAFWAGDKAGESVLKGLITERTLMIEPKGVNAFPMINRLKFVIASNADWVVPVSADERRFFVLDVSDERKGDLPYFEQVAAAIEGPELPAFLEHLQNHDLTGWQLRAAPHTQALNEQKLLGADSVTRYWMDCLSAGELIATGITDEWPKKVLVQALYAGYIDHARALGDRHPVAGSQFSKKLAPLMPGGKLVRCRPRKDPGDDRRPHWYRLGTLEEHRQAMLLAMNIDPATFDWGEEE